MMTATEKIGSNIAKYNSLPDGHKVLIEFIVSRTLANNPPADLPGVKYDPKNPSDYLKSVLANREPDQLIKLALDEEKQYTEGRIKKLKKIEMEYHEELNEVKYDPKHEQKELAIIDRYKDIYVDFIHGDDLKEKAISVDPEYIKSKRQYKEILSEEYNINEFRNRAFRAVDSDHYRIISKLNNAFQEERPKQSGDRVQR